MLKAVKFGGSSVAGAEQFRKVRAIVEADPSRRVVVISAAGKRSGDDHKLTDLLYLCHAHLTYGVPCDAIFGTIRDRFLEIRDTLGLKTDLESEFAALGARMNRDLPADELVSRGEYFTARLMADFLGFQFVDAADCVFFGLDGKLDTERTYAAIRAAYEKYGRLVIPGFYGSLPTGRIKVMTRGGSDISGALAAAAIDADVYENWTDVSGMLMADPKIVKNPSTIQSITYSELQELAFMGASVLHEDSIQPVREKQIALNIRNTNRPEDAGTMILPQVSEEETGSERFITGIAGRKNFVILTLRRHRMNQTAALCKALEVLDRYRVPLEHITLGLDSFALVVSSAAAGDLLYDMVAELSKACEPDALQMQEGIALVAAVGRKMTSKPGISGRLFHALGENGINVRTIAQGADELSIIVGVDNAQYELAIRVMYDGFAG